MAAVVVAAAAGSAWATAEKRGWVVASAVLVALAAWAVALATGAELGAVEAVRVEAGMWVVLEASTAVVAELVAAAGMQGMAGEHRVMEDAEAKVDLLVGSGAVGTREQWAVPLA